MEKTARTSGRKPNIRKMTMTALLAALATVLMFLGFNVPLMPEFIKLDFSELPALIAAFSMGPVSGVAVCLVKNIVNLMFSTTGGVGELSNFMLGTFFVLPAGLIYKRFSGRGGALVGSLLGAVAMGVVSVFSNYYIVYPVYQKFISLDAIMGMYRVINPGVKDLWQALWVFNAPFTFIKGLLSVAITFVIYKKISPLIKGKAHS